jgi:hypothetical protein
MSEGSISKKEKSEALERHKEKMRKKKKKYGFVYVILVN